jgi:hypothetical protein
MAPEKPVIIGVSLSEGYAAPGMVVEIRFSNSRPPKYCQICNESLVATYSKMNILKCRIPMLKDSVKRCNVSLSFDGVTWSEGQISLDIGKPSYFRKVLPFLPIFVLVCILMVYLGSCLGELLPKKEKHSDNIKEEKEQHVSVREEVIDGSTDSPVRRRS